MVCHPVLHQNGTKRPSVGQAHFLGRPTRRSRIPSMLFKAARQMGQLRPEDHKLLGAYSKLFIFLFNSNLGSQLSCNDYNDFKQLKKQTQKKSRNGCGLTQCWCKAPRLISCLQLMYVRLGSDLTDTTVRICKGYFETTSSLSGKVFGVLQSTNVLLLKQTGLGWPRTAIKHWPSTVQEGHQNTTRSSWPSLLTGTTAVPPWETPIFKRQVHIDICIADMKHLKPMTEISGVCQRRPKLENITASITAWSWNVFVLNIDPCEPSFTSNTEPFTPIPLPEVPELLGSPHPFGLIPLSPNWPICPAHHSSRRSVSRQVNSDPS